jgi:hypothetical protein
VAAFRNWAAASECSSCEFKAIRTEVKATTKLQAASGYDAIFSPISPWLLLHQSFINGRRRTCPTAPLIPSCGGALKGKKPQELFRTWNNHMALLEGAGEHDQVGVRQFAVGMIRALGWTGKTTGGGGVGLVRSDGQAEGVICKKI